MKRCASGLAVAIILSVTAGPAPAAAPGEVVATLDSPCKYPTGLACDGTCLYVLDWLQAEVQRLDIGGNAAAPHVIAAPTLKPHGLAWGNGKLFVSDDHTGWVYATDPDSGAIENSFEGPGPKVIGLAWSGPTLFLMESKTGQIYQVMSEDGTILHSFAAPSESSGPLTWDGAYLWVADRVKNELYRVDPASGMVLSIVAAPGPYAAGLAWDNGRLWNVDFQTRKLYALQIDGASPAYRLSDTRTAQIEYLWALYNYGPGEVRELSVALALPENRPGQELLSEPVFARPPTRSATDRWGQRCVVYELPAVAAGTRLTLSYRIDAQVSAIRWLIDPRRCGTLADIPADIRAVYTADDTRYRLDSPYLRETVRKVVGDEQNPYWIVRKLYNHVIAALEYEMAGGWDVPEAVLKRGKGSCSEYTFALIALCRAAGVPARYVGSIVVRGDDASIDEAFHRWAEVYLPNYGWIPVDANRGDAKSPADQARGFGELANRFLITTQSGGASELLEWGYNMNANWKASGYCKVEEDNFGLWQPLPATAGTAETLRAAENR